MSIWPQCTLADLDATLREVSVNNQDMDVPLLPPAQADLTPDRDKASGRRFVLAMLSVPLLAGCFQTSAPEGSATLREARRLETAASTERVQLAPGAAYDELVRALRLYCLVDDTAGAIRIRLGLAYLHEQHAQTDAAQREAHKALQLAQELGDPVYLYSALLMTGRLEQEPQYFSAALGFAQDNLQRAVLLTYLGQSEKAAALLRGLTEPRDDQVGDLAFVLFAQARDTLDMTIAKRALDLYKRADDYAGIARNLRLMAHIATQRGDSGSAEVYAARARRVESALTRSASTRKPPQRKQAK